MANLANSDVDSMESVIETLDLSELVAFAVKAAQERLLSGESGDVEYACLSPGVLEPLIDFAAKTGALDAIDFCNLSCVCKSAAGCINWDAIRVLHPKFARTAAMAKWTIVPRRSRASRDRNIHERSCTACGRDQGNSILQLSSMLKSLTKFSTGRPSHAVAQCCCYTSLKFEGSNTSPYCSVPSSSWSTFWSIFIAYVIFHRHAAITMTT